MGFLPQYLNSRMYEIWKPYTAVDFAHFESLYFPNIHLSSQIPLIGAGNLHSSFEWEVVKEKSQAIAMLPRPALSAAEDPHQHSTTQQHRRHKPLCGLLFLYSGISCEAKTSWMLWKWANQTVFLLEFLTTAKFLGWVFFSPLCYIFYFKYHTVLFCY